KASADPLIPQDQFVTTPMQTPVVIPMSATGGTGNYTFSVPANQQSIGTFVQTGPTNLTYTPDPAFSGVDTALYQVFDGVNTRNASIVVAVNIPANAFITRLYIFHPITLQWIMV